VGWGRGAADMAAVFFKAAVLSNLLNARCQLQPAYRTRDVNGQVCSTLAYSWLVASVEQRSRGTRRYVTMIEGYMSRVRTFRTCQEGIDKHIHAPICINKSHVTRYRLHHIVTPTRSPSVWAHPAAAQVTPARCLMRQPPFKHQSHMQKPPDAHFQQPSLNSSPLSSTVSLATRNASQTHHHQQNQRVPHLQSSLAQYTPAPQQQQQHQAKWQSQRQQLPVNRRLPAQLSCCLVPAASTGP
jgi:hypothetical protein